MLLDEESFKFVVKNTPLISIDLIVNNAEGRILLGKRTNPPAKEFWFVPGGRVFKDETIENAFGRVTLSELGTKHNINVASFLGVYQHFYNNNFKDNRDFSTHYIVLSYSISFDRDTMLLPTEQHELYSWFDKESILNSSYVHEYTKNYFKI